MMIGIRIEITRFLIGTVASIVLAAGLVGCTATGGVVAATPPWWEPYLSVDQDLKARGLREITLIRARSESGFLRVVGEYLNRSDATLSAIYRFTWLDAFGQPVESILSGWQAVHALPRTRVTFAGIAPRDDIQNFRVELMAAHRLKGQPERPDSGR